ncbi:MAG TPA: GNAT family N-acetyltransferase [Symbiobacteriaceae bacterium]
MIHIRDATTADYEAMLSVARSLPEWFNERGLREMARDFLTHRGLVAVCIRDTSEKVVGFATWLQSSDSPEANVAEITWLGVAREFQGQGIGRRLVEALADRCRKAGLSVLQVSTLADSVDYAPYVGTRAFYRRLGFRDWRVDVAYYGPDEDRLVLRKEL